MRRRFFVDEVRGGTAELGGDEAARLTRVLRAQVGQQYEISDNQRLYLAEISRIAKSRVEFAVLEQLAFEEPPAAITLLASLIRFERFEWMVEKATELGVREIIPVEAERSEKGLFAAAGKRVERWGKIARESSQQSRRVRMPRIAPPQRFESALTGEYQNRLFLEENPGAPPILQQIRPGDAGLLAGPEGGWTDAERKLAADAGWSAVSLGPAVLRTETAALAGLAVLTSWSIRR